MKTLMTVLNLMLLILLAGSQSCQPYAVIMGCGDRMMKTFESTADELQGEYFSFGDNGVYEWQIEVDSICTKIHMPQVKIVWQISNDLVQDLSEYKGTVKVGMSPYSMTVSTKPILNSTEITFTASDLGLKQWFEEDEPGWAYIKLNISFTSKGSKGADMEFLENNWNLCTIYVDYYIFDSDGEE